MRAVKQGRRLLAVGTRTPVLQRVVPLLQRAEIVVEDLGDALQALVRIAAHPFDLVIAQPPLFGAALARLVAEIRAPGSPCRLSGLIVLAEGGFESEARELIGRGVNRVMPIDSPFEHLIGAITELLAVAPRVNLRAPVELRLRLHDRRAQARLTTHNVSVSGMLVRGGREFPVGSRLTFELALPDSTRLVRGDAVVVRHSSQAREGVEGIALRFVTIDVDAEERLREFLGLPMPLPPEFGG
jgi:uncharacterized protein (TIGR02266 family)